MIKIEKLTRSYHRGGESLVVLNKLDLHVPENGYYALMGPSGSGKSTLLNMVGGLDSPDSGSVRVAGEEVTELRGAKLSGWRGETIGFVFQGFNLLPVLSAIENVSLPLQLTGLDSKERRKHAEHALSLVGLSDRLDHRPDQLSGGQQQRVAIARAIVTDPKIILADEPTGDLDRASSASVLELLDRLQAELGMTILMVTHDPAAAERADVIVHLDKGQLGSIEEGKAKTGASTGSAS
ncbi:MAG: putative ABC transport system ATP-binding protein [Planctomycetota bacterium]|jgi:putative ABC transport system ATP-binding protein